MLRKTTVALLLLMAATVLASEEKVDRNTKLHQIRKMATTGSYVIDMDLKTYKYDAV